MAFVHEGHRHGSSRRQSNSRFRSLLLDVTPFLKVMLTSFSLVKSENVENENDFSEKWIPVVYMSTSYLLGCSHLCIPVFTTTRFFFKFILFITKPSVDVIPPGVHSSVIYLCLTIPSSLYAFHRLAWYVDCQWVFISFHLFFYEPPNHYTRLVILPVNEISIHSRIEYSIRVLISLQNSTS